MLATQKKTKKKGWNRQNQSERNLTRQNLGAESARRNPAGATKNKEKGAAQCLARQRHEPFSKADLRFVVTIGGEGGAPEN